MRHTPTHYTNHSVFKSLLNRTSEISLSHYATGREFLRHGPATEKLLSQRHICVFCLWHTSRHQTVGPVSAVVVSEINAARLYLHG